MPAQPLPRDTTQPGDIRLPFIVKGRGARGALSRLGQGQGWEEVSKSAIYTELRLCVPGAHPARDPLSVPLPPSRSVKAPCSSLRLARARVLP